MVDIFQINITGHTNVGKTTLLRCISNQYIGIIEDRAKVTLDNTYYFDQSNNFLYVDTPGFLHIGKISALLEFYQCKNIFDNEMLKRGYYSELKCIKSLQQSNIVYYIINLLTFPPEPIIVDEINLIKHYNKNIIGVLNFTECPDINKDNLIRRCQLWHNFFNEYGIDFLCYDFHKGGEWEKYQLLSLTLKHLSQSTNINYSEGLKILDVAKNEADYQNNILKLKKHYITEKINNYPMLIENAAKLYSDIFKYNLVMNKYHTLNKFDDNMNIMNAGWIIDNYKFRFLVDTPEQLAYNVYKYINP